MKDDVVNKKIVVYGEPGVGKTCFCDMVCPFKNPHHLSMTQINTISTSSQIKIRLSTIMQQLLKWSKKR